MNTGKHPNPTQEALVLWQTITGIDPNQSSYMLGQWHLKDTFARIQEAIDLDPTEITATMLLSYFFNEYMRNREVSFESLLRSPDTILQQLEPCRALMVLLERPEVFDVRERFASALSMALTQYDAADRSEVKELLAKPDMLAILRRDALRSMKQLRVHQFLDGAPEPDDIRPVYAKVVHQWWNINSMIAAAVRMPAGVSLNLIRHPDQYQSYFAFMIRNGGNLFVLSDIENHSHPLQGYMSRRPDRDLQNRAARNWFPYDLLGMTYDEESRRVYLKTTEERALVAYQNDALPLKPIAELGAEETVWISMMFDLIVERFWRQGYKAPALSYTAEMLKSDTVLLESVKNSNLPVPLYQTIGLPALTLDDIHSNNVSEEAVGKKANHPNQWMEDRYGSQVPQATLNVVALPEHAIAVETKTGELVQMKPGFHALTDWQKKDELAGKTKLEVMNATSFGTREELERDRIFIARHNYASQITKLAKAEYEARKEEIKEWYRSRIEANLDNLRLWAGNDGLWIDDGVHPGFTDWHRYVGQARSTPYKDASGKLLGNRIFHSVIDRHVIDSQYGNHLNALYIGDWITERGGYPLCQINYTRASYYVVYTPTNPAELAWLANCSIEELPDVLQHWSQFRPYMGNSNLSRIDPMIWNTHNPWLQAEFRVRLAFSKRAIAELSKKVVRPTLPNMIDGEPSDTGMPFPTVFKTNEEV